MENASKALIIAGAILISIVLIAVGVMVVNGANGAIDRSVAQMSQQEKQVFNQTFETYQGKKTGSTVKQLISHIITTNADAEANGTTAVMVKSNITDGTKAIIGEKGADDSTTLSKLRSAIKNSTPYTISLDYAGGIVTTVTIDQ